jgi:hypothetical protein
MDARGRPRDQVGVAAERRPLVRWFALAAGGVAALAVLLVVLNGREPYAGLPEP